ncbi:MAG: metal-dependent hydrolase [Gammaproteobacteria bacterium]|jgi:inner membrane protein|nr:metal-dependent hydrolase [Gammaproteobacteria bacterium]MBT6043798.1 metal-dependent hydrolase [Gammaproteobacteria bacterium]
MDSITQFALGASIGEAVLGRKIGNRAPIIGGIIATLPDLDSFIPWDDAVASMTYHRSATHSLIVLTAMSPLITWMMTKMQPILWNFHRQLFLLVFLALFTHPLLDAFTVYGTQLFWPLTEYPVSLSTIFIVDPAYTLWLLIGFISAMMLSRNKKIGHQLNTAGLVLSSLYLTWTVAAKVLVNQKAELALAAQGISYDRLMTTPAPFNTVVWRIIGRDAEGYFDGFTPVFGQDETIKFNYYDSDDHLLSEISDHWPVQRLLWFTHGFYKVSFRSGDIFITDLRMGLEANYVFNFKVAETRDAQTIPVTSVLVP